MHLLPARPQPPSTRGAGLPSPSHSVHRELAGVLARAPGPLVDALEVPIAGCAAQPGFTEMQPPREEEGAGARLDPAAQQGADAARRLPRPLPGLEEGKLLAVDAGGAHPDDGFLQLCIVGDAPDAATDHCGEKAGRGVSVTLSPSPSLSLSPSPSTAASVTLMAAAQARPAWEGEARAAWEPLPTQLEFPSLPQSPQDPPSTLCTHQSH